MCAQSEVPGVMRPNHLADPEREAWDAYVWVENADALYAEFKAKGVGYRLCFGHDIEG